MKHDSSLVEFYFRFRAMITALKTLPTQVPKGSEDVLNAVGFEHLKGQSPTVLGVMAKNDLGSPATIHKHLHNLRRAGFLTITACEYDMRVKNITVTDQGLRHFTRCADFAQALIRNLDLNS